MRDAILKTMISLKHDDRGVTLVEYAIALLLAITFGVAAMTVLGNGFSASMGNAAAAMP